jgi:hypothetical protein
MVYTLIRFQPPSMQQHTRCGAVQRGNAGKLEEVREVEQPTLRLGGRHSRVCEIKCGKAVEFGTVGVESVRTVLFQCWSTAGPLLEASSGGTSKADFRFYNLFRAFF